MRSIINFFTRKWSGWYFHSYKEVYDAKSKKMRYVECFKRISTDGKVQFRIQHEDKK